MAGARVFPRGALALDFSVAGRAAPLAGRGTPALVGRLEGAVGACWVCPHHSGQAAAAESGAACKRSGPGQAVTRSRLVLWVDFAVNRAFLASQEDAQRCMFHLPPRYWAGLGRSFPLHPLALQTALLAVPAGGRTPAAGVSWVLVVRAALEVDC